MNQSESNFYRWLVDEKGYEEEDISYSYNATPDFSCGRKEWEVKKLYGNMIIARSKDQLEYFDKGKEESFLVIMPENPRTDKEPLFMIPCESVLSSEGKRFEALEEYCLRETVPHTLRYRNFTISRAQIERENKVTLYLKEYQIKKIREMVERDSKLSSFSQAVRWIINKHFSEEH